MRHPAEADMITSLFVDALADTSDPSVLLREWAARYPDLESEFAGIIVEHQSGEPELPIAEERGQETLMLRLFSDMANNKGAESVVDAPNAAAPSDLRTRSTARGIAYPEELARRLRLPSTLLERLALRRLAAASIPTVLIQQVASLLEVSVEAATACFVAPAQPIARRAALVQETKSAYGTPSTFADAIDNAVDIDEADRAYWKSVLEKSRTLGDE